ncbi:DUF1523 family protein [Lentibacter algarum]|uniref:DUF1523 domain-containing protein n=2 Tax=Roseobacteraceae TaxID=2854170 RepID=A0A1H3GT77_9RHOB|nr:DUF1523 family protein [Lentibacter algarum]MCO4827627.1 DUF1523 family protein [Lentibacter algarum]WIF30508.1 hypothetical protein LentiSH36_00015 [Lentibacter algarum]SDY06523.1 Protein of unknown function [Lentibacter algarum]
MRNVRRIFRVVLFVIAGLYLHYTLPQHDVAKVTGISDRLERLSSFQQIFYNQVDLGSAEGDMRDLRLINTVKVDTWFLGLWRGGERVMVYRNEDTGVYPPYFKFDSSDLEAEASALAGKEQWVSITHYGWRMRFLSIYPNAISIKPVSGPEYRPFPWFNLFFFAFLIVGFFFVRAMWRQFVERTVDPTMDALEDGYDMRKSRVQKWLDSWRSK